MSGVGRYGNVAYVVGRGNENKGGCVMRSGGGVGC